MGVCPLLTEIASWCAILCMVVYLLQHHAWMVSRTQGNICCSSCGARMAVAQNQARTKSIVVCSVYSVSDAYMGIYQWWAEPAEKGTRGEPSLSGSGQQQRTCQKGTCIHALMHDRLTAEIAHGCVSVSAADGDCVRVCMIVYLCNNSPCLDLLAWMVSHTHSRATSAAAAVEPESLLWPKTKLGREVHPGRK